jgi:hypothetical protein
MADHDHLYGAVGIEVVEEHERRVEVAGQGVSDAEMGSIEASLSSSKIGDGFRSLT